MSAIRRIIVTAIKYLAGLSAVVFWFCPLRTGIQVLVFVASIAVFDLSLPVNEHGRDLSEQGRWLLAKAA